MGILGLEPVVRAYLAWTLSRRGSLTLPAIQDIWPVMVGRAIARRTRPKGLSGGRLEVGVPDGMWLSELRFQGDRILERLRAVLPPGGLRLESIHFSVGGQPDWEPPVARDEEPRVSISLTEAQQVALADIEDEDLRALVARVVGGDRGRLGQPEAGRGKA